MSGFESRWAAMAMRASALVLVVLLVLAALVDLSG